MSERFIIELSVKTVELWLIHEAFDSATYDIGPSFGTSDNLFCREQPQCGDIYQLYHTSIR